MTGPAVTWGWLFTLEGGGGDGINRRRAAALDDFGLVGEEWEE